MKQIITLFILYCTFSSQAQQLSNQSIIGSNKLDSDAQILALPDESYLVAITSSGGQNGMKTVPSFGAKDCWILRYDAYDQLLWQKAFGGDSMDIVEQMVLSHDNQILVLCSSYSGVSGNKSVEKVGHSDTWLFKMDWDGNILWQKNYGTTSFESAKSILVHPDHSIYVGVNSSVVDGDFTDEAYGLADMLLLKLDAQGNKIWDHSYGTIGNDQIEQLQLEPYTNKVVVFGNVSEAGTGNMTPAASVAGTNCWVFKIDDNGAILEQTCFGSGTQYGQLKAAYLPDGSCWAMVDTQSDVEGDQTLDRFGLVDTWLVHLDANLQIIGQRIFGGTNYDWMRELSFDGNILELMIMSNSPVSGNKTGSCRGFADLWYLQLNATDGEILFQKTIGGSQAEYNAASLKKGTDVRFFIETISPTGADKQVSNFSMDPDIWCLTMSSTLHTNPISSNSILIYPNPSAGELHIETDFPIKNAKLSDATGRAIQSFNLHAGINQMRFSSLQPGTYFIEIGEDRLKWVVE